MSADDPVPTWPAADPVTTWRTDDPVPTWLAPMPPLEEFGDPEGWLQLDARTVLTYPFAQGGPLVIVLLIAAAVGGALEALFIRLGITVGLLLAVGALHWWRFRYRLVAGRLETRSGLVARRSKAINVDRIRGIEIEAKLAHRIAGVCAVRIEHPGAASGSRGRNRDGRDRIDAVSRAEGERLRNALLHRRAVVLAAAATPGGSSAGPAGSSAHPSTSPSPTGLPEAADQVLLRMPVRWLLYAPFSVRMLLLGPAALAAVFNSLNEGGALSGHRVASLTRGTGWTVLVLVGVLVLVLTALGSAAITYWNWTVTARGNDLVLTRGLLTRRTVAIERRRLRGVIVREPLAGRPFAAATLQVVLSGVTGSVRSAVIPLGPRPALEQFGQRLVAPATVALVRHPAGALRRRLRRGAGPALVFAVTAALIAGFSRPGNPAAIGFGLAAVIALALGLAWGRESYRTLGHALDERVVTARHGVLVRHTEVVERDRPIGLRVRQSIFARRAGVASIDVALVARGFTRISDLAAADVEQLARTLLPEIAPGWGHDQRSGRLTPPTR